MIRFLWSEGVSRAEIPRLKYSDGALPRRSVYEGIEKFKSARSSATTGERIQQSREMVVPNWRVIIDEVACSLQIRITALCSPVVHTGSGAAMSALQQQQEN